MIERGPMHTERSSRRGFVALVATTYVESPVKSYWSDDKE